MQTHHLHKQRGIIAGINRTFPRAYTLIAMFSRRWVMVCVIIERHIADGFASYYDNISQQVLCQATTQSGFVTGDALHNSYDENHRVVIAKYNSIQDWQRWLSSDERKQLMANLLPMLQGEEKITVLEH